VLELLTISALIGRGTPEWPAFSPIADVRSLVGIDVSMGLKQAQERTTISKILPSAASVDLSC
jgi:hypothetical protein